MALRIYGNRALKTLPGKDTRPTPSRVREALFNIWQGQVQGCRWLDLCAGSGAMGAEALCRGAATVTGIEQSSRACTIVRQNWQQVARPDQSHTVMRGHILKCLPHLQGQCFDRIYFDPPYASELYHPVLEAIASYTLLADDGEVAVEHQVNRVLPDRITPSNPDPVNPPFSLEIHRSKRYGITALTFYKSFDRRGHCD